MKIANDSMQYGNDDVLSEWSCVSIISMVFPAKATLNLTLTITPNIISIITLSD